MAFWLHNHQTKAAYAIGGNKEMNFDWPLEDVLSDLLY